MRQIPASIWQGLYKKVPDLFEEGKYLHKIKTETRGKQKCQFRVFAQYYCHIEAFYRAEKLRSSTGRRAIGRCFNIDGRVVSVELSKESIGVAQGMGMGIG
jgi:hypothetical protein